MSDLKSYISERNRILTEFDKEGLQKLMPALDGADDKLLTTILHKSRLECIHIEAELRHQSAQWLHDNGFKRLHGEPIILGELPI